MAAGLYADASAEPVCAASYASAPALTLRWRGVEPYETSFDAMRAFTDARDSETVFHIELVYGGLFQIMGVAPADMEPVLMIECPRFLFPFARRLISDLTTEGGFPPFRLEPIDFGGIYAARLAQQAQGAPTGLA